jgi:exocyst complex component 2
MVSFPTHQLDLELMGSAVVYKDMREGFLAEETDHGTRELREIFKGTVFSYSQRWEPVLTSNSNGSSSGPGVPPRPRERCESSEAAFDARGLREVQVPIQPPWPAYGVDKCGPSCAPSPLSDPLKSKQGKYDQALRDYKRGTFLHSSKPGTLIPGLPASTQRQREQQKRVFQKVWTSVERIMGQMKAKLDEGLKDPTRPVEEQERTIESVVRRSLYLIADVR